MASASVREKMRKVLSNKTSKTILSDDSDDSANSNGTISSMISKTSGVDPKRRQELSTNQEIKQAAGAAKIKQIMEDDNIGANEKEYAEFVQSLKVWVKAEKVIADLSIQKTEIMNKIKEQESIKSKHDAVMKQYFELDGRDSFAISDGTQIMMGVKKQTETYSVKTIPKYMEEVFDAINHEDYDFIKAEIMTINDSKTCPDINWDKLPTDPKKYLDKLRSDPKLLSNVAAIYASKSRKIEESTVIKRTQVGKSRGKGKAKHQAEDDEE
jgi:hypothetical protein